MSESFGLSSRVLELLIAGIERFPEIEEAKIFGSRAMGNFKNGSDIDIALFGAEVDETVARRLSTLLNEELPIPHHVDVVAFDRCTNEALKEHIILHGKRIA
jgi:predicted nucleotidyltransferase